MPKGSKDDAFSSLVGLHNTSQSASLGDPSGQDKASRGAHKAKNRDPLVYFSLYGIRNPHHKPSFGPLKLDSERKPKGAVLSPKRPASPIKASSPVRRVSSPSRPRTLTSVERELAQARKLLAQLEAASGQEASTTRSEGSSDVSGFTTPTSTQPPPSQPVSVAPIRLPAWDSHIISTPVVVSVPPRGPAFNPASVGPQPTASPAIVLAQARASTQHRISMNEVQAIAPGALPRPLFTASSSVLRPSSASSQAQGPTSYSSAAASPQLSVAPSPVANQWRNQAAAAALPMPAVDLREVLQPGAPASGASAFAAAQPAGAFADGDDDYGEDAFAL